MLLIIVEEVLKLIVFASLLYSALMFLRIGWGFLTGGAKRLQRSAEYHRERNRDDELTQGPWND